MTHDHPSIDSSVIEVSDNCLEHLGIELDVLCRLESALLDVRNALRSGDTNRLAVAANHQDQLSAELTDIRSDREVLRMAIAAAIGTRDDEATIRQLVTHCPEPQRSQLAGLTKRVADVAVRIDRLMQSNLIVVVHGMQLMEQIWLGLTGNQAAGRSYESTGKPGPPFHRAVFQTRC